MRRVTALLLPLLLVAGACGEEAAPATGPGVPTASLGPRSAETTLPRLVETPPQTQPMPVPTTKLPSRPPLPQSAYEELTVTRLATPDKSLRAPGAGRAQVVLACDYEEWSFQYEHNVQSNPNPPGRHLQGDERGDSLDSKTRNVIGRVLGSHGDVLADDYFARSFTEDSWPDRKLVTAFEVQRSSLTRQNVLTARNVYAFGCSARQAPPLLDAVRVSIYAPWDWTI